MLLLIPKNLSGGVFFLCSKMRDNLLLAKKRQPAQEL
jgi:hypothetical protein